MGLLGRLFNPKLLLWLFIIVGAGYLSSKFPDQAVLIGGIAIVIVIGMWMLQAEKEDN